MSSKRQTPGFESAQPARRASPPQSVLAHRRLYCCVDLRQCAEYLRLAAGVVQQARSLPVGSERNEMRQIVVSLAGLARGAPIRDGGEPTGAP